MQIRYIPNVERCAFIVCAAIADYRAYAPAAEASVLAPADFP
jgi:hypothetical protein